MHWQTVVQRHWDAVLRNGSRQGHALGDIDRKKRMEQTYYDLQNRLDRVIKAMELQVLMKFIAAHS